MPLLPPWLQTHAKAVQPHIDSVLWLLFAALDDVARQLAPLLHKTADAVAPYVQPWQQRTNALLGRMEPWQIVLLAVGATLLVVAALQALSIRWARIRKQGVVQWACVCLRAAPGIRGLLATETDKIRSGVAEGVLSGWLAAILSGFSGDHVGAPLGTHVHHAPQREVCRRSWSAVTSAKVVPCSCCCSCAQVQDRRHHQAGWAVHH